MKNLASIDIGSQTIRLLIARLDTAGKPTPVFRDRAIVRLGEAMHRTGALKETAVRRAVNCIEQFVKKAVSCGCTEITAVATASVRNASNADFFLDEVKTKTGIIPFVISGTLEAFLVLRGVESVLTTLAYPRLITDIGGGSTELILARDRDNVIYETLRLGVIELTERHLVHDPPKTDELKQMTQDIRTRLTSESTLLKHTAEKPYLTGTAGTVTTLAAMNMSMRRYQPDKINGCRLSFDTITGILENMLAIPSPERTRLPGLEKGREVVILSGTVIVLELMKLTGCNTITVSDSGLLEGILLEKVAPPPNIFTNLLNPA